MSEEDEDERKKLILFGKDVSKIPCYRSSMLWGISGGLASGLGWFMFTSKPRQASNVAMGAFMTIASVYWIQCRYFFFQTKFHYGQVQGLMDPNRPLYDEPFQKDLKETKEPLDLKTA